MLKTDIERGEERKQNDKESGKKELIVRKQKKVWKGKERKD